MTVKQLTQIERYVGPSTATKPLDCSVGSTFLEEDTSRLFVFDGTGWFPKTQDIVIYDAEGNPLGIEGGRMKVSVDASVLRDGSDPDNKLAILPDGSLKAQLSGTIVELANEDDVSIEIGMHGVYTLFSEPEIAKYHKVVVSARWQVDRSLNIFPPDLAEFGIISTQSEVYKRFSIAEIGNHQMIAEFDVPATPFSVTVKNMGYTSKSLVSYNVSGRLQ